VQAALRAATPGGALGGKTPEEVYFGQFPACRRSHYEPRARWPRGSPCAGPWALNHGRPGAELELDVAFPAGRKHLPIVALRRVGYLAQRRVLRRLSGSARRGVRDAPRALDHAPSTIALRRLAPLKRFVRSKRLPKICSHPFTSEIAGPLH
jgi:hypothetical protein